MKTTLTLMSGTYYFFSQINLIKGKSKEIDLSELTLSELRGLKSHVNAGIIEADKDISDYRSEELEGVEATVTLPPVIEAPVTEPVAVEEQEEEVQEGADEDAEEAKEEGSTKESAYDDMSRDALLSEIKARGLKTRYNREDKLREVLEEDDANK